MIGALAFVWTAGLKGAVPIGSTDPLLRTAVLASALSLSPTRNAIDADRFFVDRPMGIPPIQSGRNIL
jgi:hypothetical protein